MNARIMKRFLDLCMQPKIQEIEFKQLSNSPSFTTNLSKALKGWYVGNFSLEVEKEIDPKLIESLENNHPADADQISDYNSNSMRFGMAWRSGERRIPFNVELQENVNKYSYPLKRIENESDDDYKQRLVSLCVAADTIKRYTPEEYKKFTIGELENECHLKTRYFENIKTFFKNAEIQYWQGDKSYAFLVHQYYDGYETNYKGDLTGRYLTPSLPLTLAGQPDKMQKLNEDLYANKLITEKQLLILSLNYLRKLVLQYIDIDFTKESKESINALEKKMEETLNKVESLSPECWKGWPNELKGDQTKFISLETQAITVSKNQDTLFSNQEQRPAVPSVELGNKDTNLKENKP